MKTFLLISWLFISVGLLPAQNKFKPSNYNPKEYTFDRSDRYNPTAAMFFALVPGAGHAYLGEPIRALEVIGLMGGSAVFAIIGAHELDSKNKDTQEEGFKHLASGVGMFFLSYAYGIYDARRMAKQKNMYWRQMNLTMDWYPSIERLNLFNSPKEAVGITLAVHF